MHNNYESSLKAKNGSTRDGNTPFQIFPAADNQKRLWFIQQLLPKSPVYNLYRAIRIDGKLNPSALLSSVNAIVERHQVLRTTFAVREGKVVQIVHSFLKLEMPITDLSQNPENLQSVLDRNIQEPFDLVNEPVIRVHLIKCKENLHVFHFMVHHIAFDRRSLGLLNKELSEFYNEYTTSKKASLPELSIQYSDYCIWRLERYNTEDLDSSWKYWQTQLANLVPISLPYDKQGSKEFNMLGERVYCSLNSRLISQFEILAKENGLTMFIALLSVFKTLIYRWSGETDVSVGTPFVDRNMIGSEQLLGYFADTLVLRTELCSDQTFIELASQVKKTTLGAYRNKSLPLDTIIEKLNPVRENNRNPLFDLEFKLQTLQLESLVLGDAVLSEECANRNCSQYDISMVIREQLDGYDMRVEYRDDLFEKETIELLLQRYYCLLEAIVEDPNRLLSEYSVVLPEEKEKLLVEWNDTNRDYDTSRCLHQLFEEQVVKTPDSIAIEFENECLTYKELNERSNQLAHFLRQKGVTNEIRVGVCMERSIEMIVALYGILKAGGGYVPLDPDYPEARLVFMLEDIDAPIILTQKHLADVLPQNKSEAICLDSDWELISNRSVDNPTLVTEPESLAYIIYTSGSTGNPKGVMNQHNGIINRLIWMQEEYQLLDTDVVLQKTPYSFDVSVWEFFWPLICGAKLVIAIPGGHQNVAYLTNTIDDKKVTTMHFVPSMMQLFLDRASSEKCSYIRQIFCSGEALPYELQNQFFKFSSANLHNLYGPTEAAVDVTYWQCDPSYKRRIVPIGRPVANTKIYILDKYLKPVPVGSAGELHIGGIQVARGYLNRPELTEEKFISDPYSDDAGARLYKTGDSARYLGDGQIEYLGRIDFQVKIRGLRIELGEIEYKLAEVDGIKQCVVIVREDEPSDKRIVAYYEEKEGIELNKEEMRNQLTLGLPSYMVPQLFVKMEGLPLSPNGKIERKALPKPSSEDFESENEFVAPESRVEKAIADVWSDLLGIENIGVYDKFLELGGQSLLVLEAVWNAKNKYDLDLDPVALVRDTLEQIAATLEGENAIKRTLKHRERKLNYKPFYFGSDDSLYGIYQWPVEGKKDRGAILLCSSVYLESFNAHRAFKQLSTLLSEAGYHVLRFDYFGTGDSLGYDNDANVDRWLNDIQCAAQELIKCSGHQEISLLGFRFGAILAAMSNIKPIDKLLLWEPVFDGSKYVEQLLIKYRATLKDLNYIRKHPTIEQENEIIGFEFSKTVRESLSSYKLLESKGLVSCNHLFAFTSNEISELQRYREDIVAVNKNCECLLIEDSIIPIENYDDIDSYLPGKSLKVIVNLMKGS